MTTKEHAVERYMRAITNPESLIDHEKINDLDAQLKAATSPLERLKLQSQIQDLRNPSNESLAQAFIANAMEWATENGVTVEAFIAEGVSEDILAQAGFKVKVRGRRKASSPAPTRAARVSKETIREHIPTDGIFTIAQLVSACGGTEATVRKTIQEEINAGRVVERGTDESYSGRGKSPVRYERV